jgi:pyridoxamine 5'-phosphate oxidase
MTTVDPIYSEAIRELAQLMQEAEHRGEKEPRTGALATAGVDARPSVRTVGVLRISTGGLAIFADTKTGKGQQMVANPRAALCFHWPTLEYQAIVEGDVAWLSDADSDALWLTQPREFGLGHWASDQTQHAQDPAKLKENVRDLRRRFDSERVPRPPSWHAFEIRPDRIDLWPTGWERLRPRIRYLKAADGQWSQAKENP